MCWTRNQPARCQCMLERSHASPPCNAMFGIFTRRLAAIGITVGIAAAAVLRWLYPEQIIHIVLIALIVGCFVADLLLHNSRATVRDGE